MSAAARRLSVSFVETLWPSVWDLVPSLGLLSGPRMQTFRDNGRDTFDYLLLATTCVLALRQRRASRRRAADRRVLRETRQCSKQGQRRQRRREQRKRQRPLLLHVCMKTSDVLLKKIACAIGDKYFFQTLKNEVPSTYFVVSTGRNIFRFSTADCQVIVDDDQGPLYAQQRSGE